MVTPRAARRKKQVDSENPINFTCGECHQVHPYDSENPYACPDKEEED